MAHEAKSRVLIVADDLTGSLDAAGPFAQQGLATMVVAQPLDSDANAVSDARVVSINTDSRHLGADAAADRVERCVRHFARQRFDIVFKKIDSTLRGNVVAEVGAAMTASGRGEAVVTPAMPKRSFSYCFPVRASLVLASWQPSTRASFCFFPVRPPAFRASWERATVGAE